MDDKQAIAGADEESPTSSSGERSAPRPRARAARVRMVVAVVVGVLLLGIAADVLTASPRLCVSCHEMAARADSWARSGHTAVACVSCHQPPTVWYALPQRLADRGRLFGRDIAQHMAGGYRDPVDWRISGAAPMSDDVCLKCHDPNRKATSGFRILIDHPAHAKRNGSCVSCHVRTAHPVADRGAALSLMTQCFTCHGGAATAKAAGRCDLCHPAGYRLLPASHTTAKWKSGGHGAIAKADLKLCEMCHKKSTCDGCHGLDMPHPMGWATAGHGPVAKSNPTACEGCHWGHPDICSMCHHKAYDPAKGTWAEQHASEAKKRGDAFCISCHSPLDCVRCHTK